MNAKCKNIVYQRLLQNDVTQAKAGFGNRNKGGRNGGIPAFAGITIWLIVYFARGSIGRMFLMGIESCKDIWIGCVRLKMTSSRLSIPWQEDFTPRFVLSVSCQQRKP